MARIYVETVPSERVELDGKIYRRYPQSDRRPLRNYFSRSGRFYHVDLWVKHNGPIPDGHHIHHRDHDSLNNDLKNLVCLSAAQHAAEHPEYSNSPKQLAHLDRVRHLTKAWHASPEGLAWHAENGRRAWANRKPLDLTCQCCGQPFSSLLSDAKFCSKSCGNKQWRRDHPEYDAEKRARAKARLQPHG